MTKNEDWCVLEVPIFSVYFGYGVQLAWDDVELNELNVFRQDSVYTSLGGELIFKHTTQQQ